MSDCAEKAEKQVVIVGAGPAGLTAAWELCKAGVKSVVLEKDRVVGGIARTVNYRGYRFDIGGHRFFTKVKPVDDLWREILAEDEFLHCERLSRIYYNRKFFYYPLRAANALLGLGVWNSCLIFLSYLKARAFPQKPEDTFEQWVTNRFGKRLYNIFFKTYTEKVWGIPCAEIRAEWAAQRIKGLSLVSAALNALRLVRPKNKGEVIKTLIDAFDYPKLGPGQMWETAARVVSEKGGEVRLGAGVEKIVWNGGGVEALVVSRDGETERVAGTHFVSSMPIRRPAQLPRLSDRRPRHQPPRPLPRQLDLRPRLGGETRTHSELQKLEQVHGSRREPDVPRLGVLLLRG
jgi:protoporphyrinogen oxidase